MTSPRRTETAVEGLHTRRTIVQPSAACCYAVKLLGKRLRCKRILTSGLYKLILTSLEQ